MLRRILLTLWWTARVCAFVFIVVLGFRPSLLQLIGVGQTMIAWLVQPHVLVPLTAIATLTAADWFLQWRVRRRRRFLSALAYTYDCPVRIAFKYLRFESEWAWTHRL